MTIKGVKALLNNQKSSGLDGTIRDGVSNHSFNKEIIKDKLKKISKIITDLKKIKNG